MILLTRYLRPLGYKGSGMFDNSASYTLYYKALPECRAVLVVHNTCPQYIGVFRLTEQQWRAFKRGTLSLVPNGCCSPSSRTIVDGCDELFKGEFKNHAHASSLLATFEATLASEDPSKR